MAKFRPGKSQNRLRGKGGQRPGAGRRSKVTNEIFKVAEAIAREYIRKHIRPVLKSYKQLAAGRMVKHRNSEGKVIYTEFEADPATTRHYVDKILPTKQDVNLTGSIVINTNVRPNLGPPRKKK